MHYQADGNGCLWQTERLFPVLPLLLHCFTLNCFALHRDSWNRFDFFIVIVGMIDLMPFIEGGILTLLRIFRVLRPLRAVNK